MEEEEAKFLYWFTSFQWVPIGNVNLTCKFGNFRMNHFEFCQEYKKCENVVRKRVEEKEEVKGTRWRGGGKQLDTWLFALASCFQQH